MRGAIAVVIGMGTAQMAAAQAQPYPSGDVQKTYERLLKEIDKIPMYDNHAHPGFADDSDVDAMASPPDESATLRLRDDNPEFVAGAKALFGYPYDDFKPEHAKWLADKKAAAEKAGGTQYFDTHAGQIERGDLPGEPRDDARLSGYQAISLGIFRRLVFLSLRQQRADGQHAGHGRLRAAAGKDARALEETGGRGRTAGGPERL